MLVLLIKFVSVWRVFSAGKGHIRYACDSASAWRHASKFMSVLTVSQLPQPDALSAVSAGNAGRSLQAALPTSLRPVPRATTIISAAAASAEAPTLVSQKRGGGKGRVGQVGRDLDSTG